MSTSPSLWESLGRKWLNNEVEIENFNCGCANQDEHIVNAEAKKCVGIWFNEKQKQFVNSKSPEILISGGFRSGKTVAMICKMFYLCQFFPNNRLLLGRKSRADIDSATLPAIADIFPKGTYEIRPGPGIIEFPNGSQILLYGLDMMVSGDDTKKSAQKIKGLDLGGYFIDQLEEIEYKMYELLSSRLSRNVPFHQAGSTTNPANFWAYSYFKSNPRKGTEYIQTGMVDNKMNLPPGFLEQQLEKGEMYVRRFVYGEWSPDVLVDGAVFSEDMIRRQGLMVQKPIRSLDGINIYREPENHEYQIGIDPSIGANDPCHICCVDKETGEEVANYSGFVPTNVITEKAVQIAMMYSKYKKPLMVPEVTGVGQALVEDLKKVYEKIYEREVFNQRERKTSKKLGFHTNYATKTQLIEHMKTLLAKNFVKIRDHETVEELKTFIYSDEARMQGAGAQSGYHDDRIMAKMLAYWNISAPTLRETVLQEKLNRHKGKKVIKYQYQ